MKPVFFIVLSLKTPHGPEPYARFDIGDDRREAYDLFKQLRGNKEIKEGDILYLDLMETREGLPVNIKMLACTLDQLANNCRLITKKLFQSANLKLN